MSVLLVLLYASPPLNLRLSPGEGGKHATLGKMQSPVAIQLHQSLALVWVPQNDLVVTPAARENLAVERKVDREDKIAAIFKCQGTHI